MTKKDLVKKVEDLRKDLYYRSVNIELSELCYVNKIENEEFNFIDEDFEEKFDKWIDDSIVRRTIYCYGVYCALNEIEKEIGEMLKGESK